MAVFQYIITKLLVVFQGIFLKFVVYSFLNVPIGRLADRFNRMRIVAIAVMVWSGSAHHQYPSDI